MHRMLPAAIALFLAVLCACAAPARAAEPEPPVAPPVDAAALLAAADAAIAAGNLQVARSFFEQLAFQFPGAPEAKEAGRALRIIALRAAESREPGSLPSQNGDVVVRNEPYSRKTSERLRLTTWEKLDFGVTAFLYGMSVGLSFALSQDAKGSSEVLTPVALGAVAYTVGAIGFLKLANPDRGDLPLALAITSYAPTTTLLVMSALDSNPDSRTVGAATVVSGVLSLPIAVLAARRFDLDPGDTQLVRDAGFWGLALATVGTLAFHGRTVTPAYYGAYYEAPTGREVAVAGLIGLYGGLGLGLIAASASEVSLERVRVTTWGGYGGAVVGLLLGAASGTEQDVYRGAALGALAGLVVAFLSTGSLDGIPEEESARSSWTRAAAPALVQMVGTDGRLHPGIGVGGRL